jgi:type II secretory ATPase GspE/PulE/Tfp pilus assembly ATPase PilB-like protein
MLVLEELIAEDISEIIINDRGLRIRDHGHLRPYEPRNFDITAALPELAQKVGINPKRSLPQNGECVIKKHKIEVSFLPTLTGPSWAIFITHRDRAIPSLTELKVPLKTRTAIWSVAEAGRGLIIAPIPVLYSIAAQLHAYENADEIMTIEDRERFIISGADQYIIRTNWTELAPRALKVAARRRPETILLTRLDSRRLAELACDYASNRIVLAGVPARAANPQSYLIHLGVPEFLVTHVLKVVINAPSSL